MREELKKKLEYLKFKPTLVGGMTGRIKDVTFTAVEHPLKGLAIIADHVNERTAIQFEMFVKYDASLQEIASVLSQMYDKIHPEK